MLRKEPEEKQGGMEICSTRITVRKDLLIILAILFICLSATMVRLLPLAESGNPYHLDGIVEARYSDRIAETGSLDPDPDTHYSSTHTIHTPSYNALTAMVSLLTGETSYDFLQLMLIPITLLIILGTFLLASRLSDSARVGSIAMTALAFYGPFVLVTQGTLKEVIGLSLLPLLLLSFYLRTDIRMRVLSSSLLLVMPFIHHLVALIAVIAIGLVSTAEFLQARKKGAIRPFNVLDLLITVVAADELALYYILVRFDRLEYLTPENGLYLFLVITFLLFLLLFYLGSRCASMRWVRATWVAVSCVMIAVAVVGIVSPIYTDEQPNYILLSAPFLATLVISSIGLLGIIIWASGRSAAKTLYMAMTLAPLSLILYAFLRAVDLLSLNVLARGVVFVDFSLMIGLATFIALELKNRKARESIAICSVLLIILVASLPMAMNSERYNAVRNDVNSYEIDGIGWAIGNFFDIQTDRHYSAVARNLYDADEDSSLVRRLEGSLPIESGTTMVVSERWVDIGTNDLPFGWIEIDNISLEMTIADSDLIYIGGPAEAKILVFQSAN